MTLFLSVKKLYGDNVLVEFFSNTFSVKDLDYRTIILVRDTKDWLYRFTSGLKNNIFYDNIGLNGSLCHDCLSHQHLPIMQHVIHVMNEVLKSNPIPDLCSVCQLSKSHRLPLTNIMLDLIILLTSYMLICETLANQFYS